MIPKEELAAIKARHENATPGPWKVCRDERGGVWLEDNAGEFNADVYCCEDSDGPAQQNRDAEFAARAREDIPRLVEEVERLHELLALVLDADEMLLATLSGRVIEEIRKELGE